MPRLQFAAAAALVVMTIAAIPSAHALTMAECSAKYKAAKAAGTLKGKSWNEFRKSECSADATSSEPNTANTENAKEPAPSKAKAPKGVVFPTKVDAKFAKESPGKARMHTCLEQYKINKAKNALGGLKWIQKGGGYYSICNTKLKG